MATVWWRHNCPAWWHNCPARWHTYFMVAWLPCGGGTTALQGGTTTSWWHEYRVAAARLPYMVAQLLYNALHGRIITAWQQVSALHGRIITAGGTAGALYPHWKSVAAPPSCLNCS
eukprot:1143126-Pelagomonas_calceolata.AAC.3